MTKAYIRVKGDPSVGIADQCYQIADLDLDDEDHRKLTVRALQNCFALITGEAPKDVKVRFDDEYAAEYEAEQASQKEIDAYWKVEGLTDTYENEQRN